MARVFYTAIIGGTRAFYNLDDGSITGGFEIWRNYSTDVADEETPTQAAWRAARSRLDVHGDSGAYIQSLTVLRVKNE